MKTLQNTINQISEITSKIQKEYPELYVLLKENPMTIPNIVHPDMNKKIMEEYLEDLQQILSKYIKTHKK
jgi:predicted transcriptional regulator